jgi:hypothetical protein
LSGLLGGAFKIFFRRMEAITVAMLLIGGLAVSMASALSSAPVAAVVKAPTLLALLTNVFCVISIVFKSKPASVNRAKLLEKLDQDKDFGWQVLKYHGLLIFGYLNLLFWGGWFMCGMLLMALFWGK